MLLISTTFLMFCDNYRFRIFSWKCPPVLLKGMLHRLSKIIPVRFQMFWELCYHCSQLTDKEHEHVITLWS